MGHAAKSGFPLMNLQNKRRFAVSGAADTQRTETASPYPTKQRHGFTPRAHIGCAAFRGGVSLQSSRDAPRLSSTLPPSLLSHLRQQMKSSGSQPNVWLWPKAARRTGQREREGPNCCQHSQLPQGLATLELFREAREAVVLEVPARFHGRRPRPPILETGYQDCAFFGDRLGSWGPGRGESKLGKGLEGPG